MLDQLKQLEEEIIDKEKTLLSKDEGLQLVGRSVVSAPHHG